MSHIYMYAESKHRQYARNKPYSMEPIVTASIEKKKGE